MSLSVSSLVDGLNEWERRLQGERATNSVVECSSQPLSNGAITMFERVQQAVFKGHFA